MAGDSTTTWYYDSYEPETFPSQEKLCKAAAWTPYNLELQRASKSVLPRSPGNPMTIRLRALGEALSRMCTYVESLGQEIKSIANGQFEKKTFFFLTERFYGKDGASGGSGAPVEIIEIQHDGKKTRLEFRWVDVHLALYGFFTNFGSVLDRLSYEVNLLYQLGARRIDWPRLLGVGHESPKTWNSLNGKDAQLASFIRTQAPTVERASLYRNRLVHDGLIDFNPEISYRGITIWLRRPRDNSSPMNANALEFCKQAKSDVLKLLDGSYFLMLQYFQAHLIHTDVRR